MICHCHYRESLGGETLVPRQPVFLTISIFVYVHIWIESVFFKLFDVAWLVWRCFDIIQQQAFKLTRFVRQVSVKQGPVFPFPGCLNWCWSENSVFAFVRGPSRRAKKSSPPPLWGHRLPVTALALSARGLDKTLQELRMLSSVTLNC